MKNLVLNGIQSRLTAQAEKYRELKNQRGMTLLEIIIVLGIIGIIAAGVVILAQRAFDAKAMTDLGNNTNVVRTAMKDVFGPSGSYPMIKSTDTEKLKTASDLSDAANTQPIAQLVQLGKLSAEEARNPISSQFLHAGGAHLGVGDGVGSSGSTYFVEVSGLDQKQCRNFLLQTGNQWDFVQINTRTGDKFTALDGSEASGDTKASGGPVLDSTLTEITPTTAALSNSVVLRSLVTGGDRQITPNIVNKVCESSGNNNIVLGSR